MPRRRRGDPGGRLAEKSAYKEGSATCSDNNAAIDDLSARFRAPLISYFLRRVSSVAEAEDLTHDVFARIIDGDRLKGLKNPDSYVFAVAANLLKDRARRAHTREIYRGELEASNREPEVLTPERVLQGKEKLDVVRAGLAELTEKTRDMFILHRLEGLKHKEIADLYGVSVSAVEKHVVKALAHLARKVKEK